MKKSPDNTNDSLQSLIRRQNELIDNQNKLLERIAETKFPKQKGKERVEELVEKHVEEFVDDIDHDEIRSGYIVTSHRKKLWNVQIGLIQEFARICKKHNLPWFAHGGTLLGAARHKGFIPWDDDIDFLMFRPDYMKFQSIIEDELKDSPNYKMWYWFNYRLETDAPSKQTDLSLPLISREQAEMYPGWAPFQPLMRLLDKRTTFLQHDTRQNVYSCVFLDVFPLDCCPPFSDDQDELNFLVNRELLFATVFPWQVEQALAENRKTVIKRKELEKFLRMPYKQRAQMFERKALENFTQTPFVGQLKHFSIGNKRFAFKRQSYDETIYLPFEKIEVPAPKGYEDCLKAQYKNWRKLIVTHTHAQEWSTEIPYEQYIAAMN